MTSRRHFNHYSELFEVQAGACAICGDATHSLEIDHDPETTLIRGLLCHSCNVSLGYNRQRDPETCRYLLSPPALGRGWKYYGAKLPEPWDAKAAYERIMAALK